jgi:predicted RNase H-like HicB family nuclease
MPRQIGQFQVGVYSKRRASENGTIKKKNTKEGIMSTARFIYWQDDEMWLGYLEEYPDYVTQGKSLEELKENLKDIYDDLVSGAIPHVRKVAELEIA